MKSPWINEYAPAGYLLCYPHFFHTAIILVEYILLLLFVMIQLQLFAIEVPFSRNGSNRLDFQKK
jgi:hypothetical protein